MSHRVLSDIVVPKRAVADQIFHTPPPRIRPSSGNRWRRSKIVVICIAALGIGMGASFWFARMEVRIAPRTASVALDASSLLTRDPQEKNKLFARTLAVSDVREGTFPGSFTITSVERRARGKIVIFNKASQAPQALISETRFEAPDGKIYRIAQTITIPGYARENGEIIPGSREVEVIADKPGAEYNIGLVDFTIPGFKGSHKFETVFARSKIEMTGGFTGTEQAIRAEDLERAIIALRIEGEANAEGLLRAKTPLEEFLLKESIEYAVLRHEENPIEGSDNSFRLVLRAEARGFMVGKGEFVKLIRDPVLRSPFHIVNLEQLNYKLEQYSYESNPGLVQVAGEALLESLVDAEKMRSFMVERRIATSKEVLEAFWGLESVSIRFRPFWLRRVPSHPARIDIIVEPR